MNRLSLKVEKCCFSASWVRFAGGGGRPGGRPAFNWKEKMQLRIDNKEKKKLLKNRPTGNYDEYLKPHFDASRGDMIIDLANLTNFKPPDELRASADQDKKKIQMKMLFGSNKPFGILKRPETEPHKFSKKYRKIATLGE